MTTREPTVEESKTTLADAARGVSEVAVGTVTLVSSPLFLPGVQRVTRPVLKTAIRAGLAVGDAVGSPSAWVKGASGWVGRAPKNVRRSVASLRAEWAALLDEARRERRAAAEEAARREQREAKPEKSKPRGKHRKAEEEAQEQQQSE